MTDLIYEPLFSRMIQVVMDRCRASGNAVSIVVCDKEGKDTFVATEASGEDVAFMAAETVFSFCKKVSEDSGLPVGELVRMTHQEISTYLAIMIRRDDEQMELLNNPVGMA